MSIFFHYGDFNNIVKRCPITFIIILINCVYFVVTLFTDGFTIGNLIRLGGLYPFLVIYGNEYYRLLTTIFLHGSILHFLFNTFFGLLIICAGLEKIIGSLKFALIYFGSGLVSSLMVTIFSKDSLTVGASGAIYGVLGAFLVIIIYKKYLLSYQDQRYIRDLLIINLIFTFLTPFVSVPGHLGGFVGGFLLGLLVVRIS